MLGQGPISSAAISALALELPTTDIVNFAGLVREILVSENALNFSALTQASLIKVTTTVAFSGLVLEVLTKITSTVNFDGLVRETLLQPTPPFEDGPIPIFPVLPQGFPIKFNPSMDTIIGTTKSLREMRVAQRRVPLWDIEILFEELRDQTQNQTLYAPFTGFQQYEELVQLWLMMYGQTNVFGFDCFWDNSRENQFIGAGDSRTQIFTIYRTWGQGAQATLASIGLINEVFDVKINNILVPNSEYIIIRNKIYFNTPPAMSVPITMSFSFYYLCRFIADEQDFEEFAKDRWAAKSLKMRAVNWP